MEGIKIELRSNGFDYQSINGLQTRYAYFSFTGRPLRVHTGSGLTPEMLDQFHCENSFLVGYIGYPEGFRWLLQHGPSKKEEVGLPGYYLAGLDSGSIDFNPPPVVDGIPATIPLQLTGKVTREKYIAQVNRMKEHLHRGDIYEVNYCIPFVTENIEIHPETIWTRLNHFSPMPFSAFIDTPDFSIISASPERFIRKNGDRVFLQPMKGTSRKGKSEEENQRLMMELKNDPKERSENVMIVDLSRNDLSTFAKKASVTVDELFGVYEFPTVLQMVSTVSCETENTSTGAILRSTFPMGSMTGAPKHRAMQIIDEYEDFSRGPFSGMLGYIDPNNDFDFSVLIRTIFYDKKQRKLLVAVGSAITTGSVPEKEYEECLIKLQPLLNTLNATLT